MQTFNIILNTILLIFLISCSASPEVEIGDCVQRADRNDAWRVLEIGDKIKLENTRDSKIQWIGLDSRWMISQCP